MSTVPQISDAEWKIMKILWESSPMTASEVLTKLDNSKWKATTVKTLLSRLVKKEALGFEVNGRTYNYYPLINEEECVKAESKSFLKKVYDGGLKVMFANFLEMEDLSEEELEELRGLLEEKK